MNVDFISLLDKLSVLESTVPAVEASPNTLKGSFSKDLIKSKKWLTNLLAKILKNKNPGTIYVLGSWYGNIGLYLDQAGVKFDRLVLIDPDSEALTKSKELLSKLDNENRLVLVNKKAEDCNYKKPGIIINTSCNETGPLFLRNIEDNMLCILQSRNNVNDVLTTTDNLDELVELFPLKKTYYTGEKSLNDIETEYNRYMVIGRAGKNLNEGDEEHHTGGSLGLPFPGTYEQEYNKFKRKGPRRITAMTNEALDSSYPYEFENNAYYFTTDAGNDYKVMFNGTKKVEVSFVSRDKAGQVKDTATGSGDSRKVFGTVIDIVKDYVSKHNPEILMFAAVNDEPSRVRLYNMLASQAGKALPGYNFAKTLKNNMLTSFYLTRDNIKVPKLDTVKNALDNTLDKVFEDTTTLTQIYQHEKPDDNEQIWDYGTMIWDQPLEIKKITARELDFNLCHQYDVEGIEDLFDKMEPEQHDIVNNYINDPNLSNYIIILDNGHIVDGNHRAIAAALTGKSLRYVDIGEEE